MEIKLDIRRVIEDGNFVAKHSGYTDPMVGIDISDLKQGK